MTAGEHTTQPRAARDEEVVEAELLEPDVFEGQHPSAEPSPFPPTGDHRPDVPRTPDGEPTDFAPLQVPVLEETVVEETTATPPAEAPTDSQLDEAARWQELQGRFVDDPAAAVAAAADLVDEAVARLRDGISAAGGSGDSTEQLRRAFRRYREIHRSVLDQDHP